MVKTASSAEVDENAATKDRFAKGKAAGRRALKATTGAAKACLEFTPYAAGYATGFVVGAFEAGWEAGMKAA